MIIIVDFCQNHNGDFELLKDMASAAKEAGADYGKIQTIFANQVSYRERFETGIVDKGKTITIKRPYKDEVKRLKPLELSYEKQQEFIEYCKKIKLKPLTTAFTKETAKKIREIGFQDIKIASYDCASEPLLKLVRDKFQNIFVSTGATFDDEIERAARILVGTNYWLLHCVTMYPTPLEQFHLSRMNFLKKFTRNVGYSDHSNIETDGILGSVAAMYYGAKVLERHFTILPCKATRDGIVSLNPEKLLELNKLRNGNNSMVHEWLLENFPKFPITKGEIKRKLTHTELMNRDYYRGRFCDKKSNGVVKFNWEE